MAEYTEKTKQPHTNLVPHKPTIPNIQQAQPLIAPVVQRTQAMPTPAWLPTDVMTLQRTIGNQAVAGLLRDKVASNPPLRVQPKLRVGAAGDRFSCRLYQCHA